MSNWNGQKVVIIGAARQGVALARYLAGKGAHVVLNDKRPAAELQPVIDSLAGIQIEWALGGHPLKILDGASLVCPSGGVPLTLPLVVEARRRGIRLSNDSQIFLEAAPCPSIGITGSAGKTTTTTLVGRMIAAWLEAENARLSQPRRPWIGGNIGSPLVAEVDGMQPADIAVLELSSFQLEIMTRSPHVAAVLNVTPNHLDRHANMEEYTAAKARILDFQVRENAAILGREDPGAWGLASRVQGRLYSFGLGDLPADSLGTFMRQDMLYLRDENGEAEIMPRSRIQLRGEHNLLNVLAACAISAAAGAPLEALRAGVEGFRGVAHRLEFVRSYRGAAWYNDSIATAPERVMAAIRSFDEPLVLLAGGRDKNLPWQEFAALARRRVRHLVLFGEAAGKVEQALQEDRLAHSGPVAYSVVRCGGLQEAVREAAELAQPGDVVLLSPGGTSFDEFRDFEERGEAFRKWVMQLG